MKKLLALLLLLGVVACNTNQNYDKSMLPDADPTILSKVNSRVLITCMQLQVLRPPIPINADHRCQLLRSMIKTIVLKERWH